MLFALSTDSAKTFAIVGVVAALVIAVVAALVIKAIVTKMISLAVAALFAFLFYSQRSSIEDCAKRVKDNSLVVQATEATECKFFGITVTVPTDKRPNVIG